MKFDMQIAKALVGEFLCTFVFIFTICANHLSEERQNVHLGSLGAAVSTAFVAIAIIYTFGGHSGAHFNPAVTLGALIGRKINPIMGALYIVLQLLAACAATGTLVFLYPGIKVADSLLLAPAKGVTLVEAVAMEATLTFILVLVIYGTAMGVRTSASKDADLESATNEEDAESLASNKQKMNFAPIAIGLTLGFLCFLGGTVSGGAFNPARATAPALLAWKFTNLWIYWVGDLVGASLAAILYHFFFEH